jgi:hypothetical protein
VTGTELTQSNHNYSLRQMIENPLVPENTGNELEKINWVSLNSEELNATYYVFVDEQGKQFFNDIALRAGRNQTKPHYYSVRPFHSLKSHILVEGKSYFMKVTFPSDATPQTDGTGSYRSNIIECSSRIALASLEGCQMLWSFENKTFKNYVQILEFAKGLANKDWLLERFQTLSEQEHISIIQHTCMYQIRSMNILDFYTNHFPNIIEQIGFSSLFLQMPSSWLAGEMKLMLHFLPLVIQRNRAHNDYHKVDFVAIPSKGSITRTSKQEIIDSFESIRSGNYQSQFEGQIELFLASRSAPFGISRFTGDEQDKNSYPFICPVIQFRLGVDGNDNNAVFHSKLLGTDYQWHITIACA